jgi:hypothetical protein
LSVPDLKFLTNQEELTADTPLQTSQAYARSGGVQGGRSTAQLTGAGQEAEAQQIDANPQWAGTAQNFNTLMDNYLAASGYTPQQIQALKTTYTPQAEQQYNQLIEGATNYASKTVDNQVYGESLFDTVLGDLALTATVAGATAGVGATLAPEIGAAGSVLSGTAGSVANGAVAGAAGGALNSGLTGQNVGTGVLEGAVGGGLGAAAAPAASSLSNATGLSSSASMGLVKGAIGAGTGALGAELTGGNVEESALSKGVSGLVSGGLSGSGLPGGNLVAGAIGNELGGLAGSTLTSPSGQKSPATATQANTPALASSLPTSGAQSISADVLGGPTVGSSTTPQTTAQPGEPLRKYSI